MFLDQVVALQDRKVITPGPLLIGITPYNAHGDDWMKAAKAGDPFQNLMKGVNEFQQQMLQDAFKELPLTPPRDRPLPGCLGTRLLPHSARGLG